MRELQESPIAQLDLFASFATAESAIDRLRIPADFCRVLDLDERLKPLNVATIPVAKQTIQTTNQVSCGLFHDLLDSFTA